MPHKAKPVQKHTRLETKTMKLEMTVAHPAAEPGWAGKDRHQNHSTPAEALQPHRRVRAADLTDSESATVALLQCAWCRAMAVGNVCLARRLLGFVVAFQPMERAGRDREGDLIVKSFVHAVIEGRPDHARFFRLAAFRHLAETKR